jgi:uncharacterized RDD family membrane protein YckC
MSEVSTSQRPSPSGPTGLDAAWLRDVNDPELVALLVTERARALAELDHHDEYAPGPAPEDLLFPESSTGAFRGRRAGAVALDALLTSGAMLLIAAPLVLVLLATTISSASLPTSIWCLIAWLTGGAYRICAPARLSGTPGQRIMDLRLVRQFGTVPLDVSTLAMRWAITGSPLLIASIHPAPAVLAAAVLLAWPLVRADGRSVADLACNTYVTAR